MREKEYGEVENSTLYLVVKKRRKKKILDRKGGRENSFPMLGSEEKCVGKEN